jgi:hypothetical protein
MTGTLSAQPVDTENARNILANGGFEQGTENWTLDPGQRLLEDPDQAHAGRACLFGEVTDSRQACTLAQSVTVTSRNLYEFEIWARATNRTKLVLWVVKPGAEKRTIATAWENVPAKWTRYRIPITIPQDGTLQLQIIAPSSFAAPPGKIWVDDIALYETVLPLTTTISSPETFADEPALAAGTDGAVYAAWNAFRNNSDALQAARFALNPDGSLQKTFEKTVVPAGNDVYLLHPFLAATGTGATLLYAQETGTNDWDIHACVLAPDGPGRPFPVTSGDGIDVKPHAVWHGNTLWVVWESNRSGGRAVFLTTVRDGKAGPAERVSTGPGSAYAPSVAALASGEVAVAWHQFDAGNADIRIRRRSRDGAWAPEARLTSSPAVDRHARLAANGDDLWLVYEHALITKYRIGATRNRRLLLAKIQPDNSLLAPSQETRSGLNGRCEAASPIFDSSGRLWIAHLRPRGRRSGWDTFLTGFNGSAWTQAQRGSAKLGLDRRPALAISGNKALVAFQNQPALKRFTNREQAMEDVSSVDIVVIDLANYPPATALDLIPFTEPDDEDDTPLLRQTFGDGNTDVPAISYQGRELKLVFGDLHEHTDVSQCNRLGDQSIDESYQHMRDIASLDFAAATDHGYNITPYLWNYTAKLARINYDPGHFLTFLGEEWTSSIEEYSDEHPYGYYGHRNLILADAYFPRWWNAVDRQTPAQVWQDLRRANADFVHIPHQIADTGNVPTDWNYVDETAQPVAEIFQVRGSYEYKGAPREAARSTPEPGYFIQDAWARGIVIGVIASPDHGGGIGKACVFTPELSRKAVLQALRERHCFGTTAARMFLDVRVNGHLMGEKIAAADGKPVTVTVNTRCPADIDRIEVCRNNTFIYSTQPQGTQAAFEFVDPAPVPGRSYYYVRVIQKDNEIAWSSPVWLGYD